MSDQLARDYVIVDMDLTLNDDRPFFFHGKWYTFYDVKIMVKQNEFVGFTLKEAIEHSSVLLEYEAMHVEDAIEFIEVCRL